MGKGLTTTTYVDALGRRVMKGTRPVRYVVYTGHITDTDFEVEDAVKPYIYKDIFTSISNEEDHSKDSRQVD